MKNKIREWCVYLIKCKDDFLYCGVTKINNIHGRIAQHNAGTGAKYTRGRKPVKLIAFSNKLTKSEALKLEWKVKHQPRDKKLQKVLTHGGTYFEGKNKSTTIK